MLQDHPTATVCLARYAAGYASVAENATLVKSTHSVAYSAMLRYNAHFARPINKLSDTLLKSLK